MRKRIGIITFVSLIVIDLVIKILVIRSGAETFLGPIGIGPLIGERDVTAAFSDFPLAIKNVVLLTVVGFFVATYLVAALLVRRNLGKLYFAFSIMLAGLTANVFDSALNSGATSVFLLGNADAVRYHFNLADIYTFVGLLLTAHATYRAVPILFPVRPPRRNYWINPEFQGRHMAIICSLGLSYALVIGLFGFSFVRAILAAGAQDEQNLVNHNWLMAFVICFFLITSVYLLLLLIFTRRLTHSIAGPLFAFERAVRASLAGQDAKLHLRDTDEFRNLQALAEDINAALRKQNQ